MSKYKRNRQAKRTLKPVNNRLIIQSKYGFLFIFSLLLYLWWTGLCGYLFIQEVFRETPDWEGVVVTFFGILIGVWFLSAYILVQVKVTRDYLELRGIWGVRQVHWNDVSSVMIWYNGRGRWAGFAYWIQLRASRNKNRRRTYDVHTFTIANRSLLMMAILESAKRANSSTIIDGQLLEDFGDPPYGFYSNLEERPYA